MEIYTTSFTYPRRSRITHSPASSLDFSADLRPPPDSYSQLHQQHVNSTLPDSQGTASPSDYEAVQKVAMMAMAIYNVQISFAPADQGRAWNFQVSGVYQQVMLARGMIMKECPIQNRAVIKVVRSEILDSPSSKPTLKPEVRRHLDEIASQTFAHIAVVNSTVALSTRSLPDGVSNNAGWSGLETERVCELQITGQGDSVELARVRLLVMLDEVSGLHAESCEIDQKLLAIIAGRKRGVLQSIMEETATNIYMPSPLQGLIGPEFGQPSTASPAAPSNKLNPNVIWITGEFFGVQRARDMIFQVSMGKSKQLISRDTAILPRKLDWMVTERAEDLKAIMHDNATFIQFPPIGSSTSMITVYGDHRVNIQRSVRAIMQLACQFYVASLWLLPAQFNVLLPSTTNLNHAQASTILKQISYTSGAEVVFKGMNFEMYGLEHEVRPAVNMLLELDIVKAFHHEIRFQIELANEHREFISGKKNGKINKIMQTTNVKIKFETFNDHNFLIDIAGNDGSVLQGLTLLQEELPAEISFHVPESYHKRIIGVGGRSIQRIMKKYGVYVKFSNAEEFASMGGYYDNDDNVVARTPSKNAMNLDNLKQSVMELVNPKDKDYINETVSIPRKYHRTLLGEKAIFIHDIETKTNSKFRFPDKETASDLVTIFGPESQVQIAATMLLDHVPFEADMAVPPNPELARVCASPEFHAFIDKVKRDFQVIIVPNIKGAPPSPSQAVETPLECSFKFRCQRSNSDFLVTAREVLEQFLLAHNIHVYPSVTSRTHKRGDSFADAFPHFDSKVLSTARTRHQNSADLGRPSESMIDRRLRLASSSPDVKALFNGSPSYIYHLEEEDDYDQPNYLPGPSTDQWTPLPPMVSGERSLRHARSVLMQSSHGSQLPIRARQSEDALKRGSDSLLEAKLKDHLSQPRSLNNRAQSLDLTMSLSRINEGSRLSRADSPENSITETGGSSPTSINVPSFPSVYASPSPVANRSAAPSAHGSIGRSSGLPHDEEAIEEVSRVISTLGL
ncbi:cytoplasmic protein [Irpex rosettiformis]|uniref:Cytoplasmic protein n=1 Tax=Irpex rosettiformis TaxID=378272 RepID=A0ACB8TUB7_9APHY|nr:cytoplasmic protein [Irpex rosettiformis]